MSDGDLPSDDAGDRLQTEATGETVGEAKWAALRELERRFPGLDKSTVEFAVLSEGERGLLGVGFVPARVVARLPGPPEPRAPGTRPPAVEESGESSPAEARVRELLLRVRDALALDATFTVRNEAGGLLATFEGRDLGLVIGKHGQTIDALQYLANAVATRAAGERTEVVLDAAGYRERRKTTLEALADRTAERVATTGSPVALDPMTSSERKIVHLRLKDRPDVVTSSDGSEPNRHVVVSPAG
jgi:spoIIIJ-associated protein